MALKDLFKKKPKESENGILPEISDIKEMNSDKNISNAELAKIIVELLKNPEKREDMIDWLIAQKFLPDEVISKAAKEIPNVDDVPNGVAASLTRGLPDTSSLGVLYDTKEELTIPQTKKIINNMDEDRNKEKGIIIKLEDLYNKVKGKNDRELRGQIENLLYGYETTNNIKKGIYNIIAKNLAMQYKNINGIMPDILEKLVPPEEMLKVKMPEKIESEYKRLIKPGQENKYNKEEVKKLLLEHSAKNLVEAAKSQENEEGQTGTESAFVQDMGDLTEEEMQYFLTCVKKYNKEIGTIELTKIKDNLQGTLENTQEIEEMRNKVRNKINNLSKEQIKAMSSLLDNSELIEKLSKIKDEKLRNKVIQVFGESIPTEKQQAKTANSKQPITKDEQLSR